MFTRDTSRLTDDLDASFDGGIVVHEYGHGISTRLVAARGSADVPPRHAVARHGRGLVGLLFVELLQQPGPGRLCPAEPGSGMRRYSYSGYPYTYEDLGIQGFEVHDDGEIWAGALWDLRGALGQAVTDRLVIDGLRATPCRPSMNDARDGILAADAAGRGRESGADLAGVRQTRPGLQLERHRRAALSRHLLQRRVRPAGGPAGLRQPGDRRRAARRAPRGGENYTYSIKASNPAGGTSRTRSRRVPAA